MQAVEQIQAKYNDQQTVVTVKAVCGTYTDHKGMEWAKVFCKGPANIIYILPSFLLTREI